MNNGQKNREIALDLFLRDPLVDIQHTICASDLVWRISTERCPVINSNPIRRWSSGKESWIGINQLGISEDSKIPALISPYLQWFNNFGIRDGKLVAYLRPALWLYILVFNQAVMAIRRRDLKALTAGSFVCMQAGLLFLISFTSNFRYHFSVNLVGIFALGWVFINRNKDLD